MLCGFSRQRGHFDEAKRSLQLRHFSKQRKGLLSTKRLTIDFDVSAMPGTKYNSFLTIYDGKLLPVHSFSQPQFFS